jgi:hypothetical protein
MLHRAKAKLYWQKNIELYELRSGQKLKELHSDMPVKLTKVSPGKERAEINVRN